MKKALRYLLLFVLALVGAAFLPFDVLAAPQVTAATDIKTQSVVIGQQMSNIPKLIAITTYVMGTFFAVKGLLAMKDYINEPEKNPISQCLGYLVVSSLLILLPYTIGVFKNTLAMQSAAVDAGSPKMFQEKGLNNPNTKSFSNVQYNVAKNSLNFPKLVAVFAYVIGAFFAATGLIKIKDWINDSDRNPLNPALVRLVTAALLIAFPHVMFIATGTFFTHGTGNNTSVEVDVSTKMGQLSAFKLLGK